MVPSLIFAMMCPEMLKTDVFEIHSQAMAGLA
jgi:hypothetical protein